MECFVFKKKTSLAKLLSGRPILIEPGTTQGTHKNAPIHCGLMFSIFSSGDQIFYNILFVKRSKCVSELVKIRISYDVHNDCK